MALAEVWADDRRRILYAHVADAHARRALAAVKLQSSRQGIFMSSAMTPIVLIFATLFSGLLAGGNIDRAFVAMPAWQQVGAIAWSEFSRHADLGNGLIVYPVEAIAGALLTAAAAVGSYFDRGVPRPAALCLYAAALFAAGGLMFTVKAAPIMLGLRDGSDPAALQQAFEGFWFWGNLRAVCQVLTFFAQLLALAALLRNRGWQSSGPT